MWCSWEMLWNVQANFYLFNEEAIWFFSEQFILTYIIYYRLISMPHQESQDWAHYKCSIQQTPPQLRNKNQTQQILWYNFRNSYLACILISIDFILPQLFQDRQTAKYGLLPRSLQSYPWDQIRYIDSDMEDFSRSIKEANASCKHS